MHHSRTGAGHTMQYRRPVGAIPNTHRRSGPSTASRSRITAVQLARITDPYEMPAYGIAEAAHYLQLPVATLKSWVLGRHSPTKAGRKLCKPIIRLPDPKAPLLTFYNLAVHRSPGQCPSQS